MFVCTEYENLMCTVLNVNVRPSYCLAHTNSLGLTLCSFLFFVHLPKVGDFNQESFEKDLDFITRLLVPFCVLVEKDFFQAPTLPGHLCLAFQSRLYFLRLPFCPSFSLSLSIVILN